MNIEKMKEIELLKQEKSLFQKEENELIANFYKDKIDSIELEFTIFSLQKVFLLKKV